MLRAHVRTVSLPVVVAVLVSCAASPRASLDALPQQLADLERARGGRLGVAVLDTADGSLRGHRLDERFALCSTFKLVLAAMVLERAAHGGRALDERLRIAPGDLLSHAPVTRGTAANLLLRDLGGFAPFHAFCRAHGDAVTRLDRFEPEMNDVRPGDERDTTTPRAYAQLVARLFGGGLAPASRQTLRQWMFATATGAGRVRKGLPPDWPAGDKTGTGGGGDVTVKCNDVVWLEPPGRAPLVIAVYYDSGVVADWPSETDEDVLAEVGRLVAHAVRTARTP
jgi:beta-lactamase class A